MSKYIPFMDFWYALLSTTSILMQSKMSAIRAVN